MSGSYVVQGKKAQILVFLDVPSAYAQKPQLTQANHRLNELQ